eukprot:TRINITY_DN16422_c0_g1_i4.p2 TRINITY_DN16422_c0_g1~~TRINITY_DN16422_c0_g1_i4.p2  ORF type:complete len:155 (-),score=44.50 TRINITY_DN16422_c0_g1_i4:107-571(-)
MCIRDRLRDAQENQQKMKEEKYQKDIIDKLPKRSERKLKKQKEFEKMQELILHHHGFESAVQKSDNIDLDKYEDYYHTTKKYYIPDKKKNGSKEHGKIIESHAKALKIKRSRSKSKEKKAENFWNNLEDQFYLCLLYTSPSPRDLSTSRMPSSA